MNSCLKRSVGGSPLTDKFLAKVATLGASAFLCGALSPILMADPVPPEAPTLSAPYYDETLEVFVYPDGFTEATTIIFTLEGCGNDVKDDPRLTLPYENPTPAIDPAVEGKFACPDPDPFGGNDNDYTTGNVKTWNELDLLPFRLHAANKVAEEAEFDVLIGHDYDVSGAGLLGFDEMTPPEIFRLSSGGCSAEYGPMHIDDVTGGTSSTILRQVRITVPGDGACTLEWAGRLALGSSRISGSSLQTYKFETDTQQGKATVPVPIPPNPVELAKEMSAVQGSEYNWTVSKSATPVEVNFGNTCDLGEGDDERSVTIDVTWTKIGPTPSGDVSVTTLITATNPASRELAFDIEDLIKNGADEVIGEIKGCENFVVDPYSSDTCELEWTIAASAINGSVFDEATAIIADPIFGDCECELTAEASSGVSLTGPVANDEAYVVDTEWLTAASDNFEFSLDSVLPGDITFGVSPAFGTTVGVLPADAQWTTKWLSGSGAAELSKTVYFVGPTPATTGELKDVAKIYGSSSGLLNSSNEVTIDLKTNPLVDLTIKKSIEYALPDGSEVEFCFSVTGDKTGSVSPDPCIKFTSSTGTMAETTLEDLDPDTYTVVEKGATGWKVTPDKEMVNLTAVSAETCADAAEFDNTIPGRSYAKVVKVTLPASDPPVEADGWVFELFESGEKVDSCMTVDGACEFDWDLEYGKSYTVTENLKDDGGYEWVYDSKQGNCTAFSPVWPDDFLTPREFKCTYKNVQKGGVIVEKFTIPAAQDVDFDYTEDLTETGVLTLNAVNMSSSTEEFIDIANGSYEVIEDDPSPDCSLLDNPCTFEQPWDLIAIECTDDYDENGYNANDSSVDLATFKASIALDPGETVYCSFTNQKRGSLVVYKTLSGGVPAGGLAGVFAFDVLLDGAVIATKTTDVNGVVDFGYFLPSAYIQEQEQDPNKGKYALCEQEVDAGWKSSLEDDPDVFFPMAPDNSYVCVPFTVDAGASVTAQIDNMPPPGGNARTIGYWRNWSGDCTNGNQEDKLGDALGSGVVAGLLSWPGNPDPTTCDAVNIISKRNLMGENRAVDPAYAMGSQFMAAQLNWNAGADQCGLGPYFQWAQDLLLSVEFNGYDKNTGPKKKDKAYVPNRDKAPWMYLAGLFDSYNNNELACPVPPPAP